MSNPFTADKPDPKGALLKLEKTLLSAIPIARHTVAILTTIAFFLIGHGAAKMMMPDQYKVVHAIVGLLVAGASYMITDRVWYASAETLFSSIFTRFARVGRRGPFANIVLFFVVALFAAGFLADIYAIKHFSEEVELAYDAPPAPDIGDATNKVKASYSDQRAALLAGISEADSLIKNADKEARRRKPNWANVAKAADKQSQKSWAHVELKNLSARIVSDQTAILEQRRQKLYDLDASITRQAETVGKALGSDYETQTTLVKRRSLISSSNALYLGLFCKIILVFMMLAVHAIYFDRTGGRDTNRDGRISFEDMGGWVPAFP